MSTTPVHDWLNDRLAALFAEADRLGFARDVVVAAATDILNVAYNPAVPDPRSADDADPGEVPPPHDSERDALDNPMLDVRMPQGFSGRGLKIDLPE